MSTLIGYFSEGEYEIINTPSVRPGFLDSVTLPTAAFVINDFSDTDEVTHTFN
jgi:hypothetical protein